MSEIIDMLFFKTWWTWVRPDNAAFSEIDYACRIFNFVEAAAWFLFSALVLLRWSRYRRSHLELWYALSFVLFGISDGIEAWVLTSWLLWWKAINLVWLFLLRRKVMQQFYPMAKVF